LPDIGGFLLLNENRSKPMIDADTDLAQLQETVKLLSNWCLSTINFNTDWDEDCEVLQLCFIIENGQREITLSLFDIAHMVYSRFLHDEACYFVGEVVLEPVLDGGKAFSQRFKNLMHNDYPSEKLYSLHIEGGIGMEILCARVQGEIKVIGKS
jgi:hypothetical protein